jgi:hypothetical protein
MKNRRFFAGMLVLVLIFVLIVIGCDNGTTDEEPNPFIGTWQQKDAYRIDTLIITKTDWTWRIDEENDQKGTYTYENNTVIFQQTHEWEDDHWEIEQDFFTLILSANEEKLEGEGFTFQKK